MLIQFNKGTFISLLETTETIKSYKIIDKNSSKILNNVRRLDYTQTNCPFCSISHNNKDRKNL